MISHFIGKHIQKRERGCSVDDAHKKESLLCFAHAVCRALLILLAAWICVRLMLPFLLGLAVAWLLRPVVRYVTRHSGMGKRGACIAAAALFYGALAVAVWLLGLLLFAQVQVLGERLPALYEGSVGPFLQDFGARLTGWLVRLLPHTGMGVEEVFRALNEALRGVALSASQWAVDLLAKLAAGIPAFLLALTFTILSSVIICVEYERVCAFVLRQIPQRLHGTALGARDFLAKTLLRTLRAYLLLSLITFAELLAGLWALRIRNAAAIAAAIALLDLLPVLGSGTVLLPWAVYLFLAQNYLGGGGMLALWILISAVRQVLEPKILGDETGQHPLVTLIAMYAGLRLAGFWGLLLMPVACLMVEHLQQEGAIKLYRQ